MNSSKVLLKAMLGDRGYETLEKAIFKQRTSAVIDPLEYYLPLIVVPRTIISWLVQTIKPMKTGEIKDINFPGRDDIKIHFEKQDIDQYRAEFVSGGKIIHTFEKQSLPAASAHLMTVGEMYESFTEEEKKADPVQEEIDLKPELEEPKKERPEYGALEQMISMANVTPPHDPESIKWEMSHANVRELTAVIGKLVDSLTARQLSANRLEDELDKQAEKEVKGDPQKRENDQTPEEKNKADIAAAAANPAIKEKQEGIIAIRDHKAEPTQELAQEGPDPKKVKDGEEAAEGKIAKESPSESKTIHAASMNASKNISSPRMAGAHNDQDQQRNIAGRMSRDKSYFRKKHEILTKPGTSPAAAGIAANAAADKDKYKTRMVTGSVSITAGLGKDEMGKAEMPKGAGQPKGPKPPQAPKPPVPAGNNPQASAAKQAQSSGTGGYKPPQTPGAVRPKNPTIKPKMTKNDYFRGHLGKSIQSTATEEQLYKSACPDCGKAEFIKAADGNPEFNPCACFRVLKKDEEGRPSRFVQAIHKADGTYDLQFDKNADPEVVKMFLLTMKAHLLIRKKHGI